MLSLLDLEGIPRGTGSGSCNAGRTGLPDLGTDIVGVQNSLAIDAIGAQTQADLVATGDDWIVVFGGRTDAGSFKSTTAQSPSISYALLFNDESIEEE